MQKTWMMYSALLLATLTLTSPSFAHDDAQTRKPHAVVNQQKAWGIAGDAKAVKRTISISMTDAMRFSPDKVEIRQGETVRFDIKNEGKMLHEFVIGTKRELDEHAAMMVRFPNMEHHEPYMQHVPPGEMRTITWKFNRAGLFDFACLIAGHYQAGMVGKIVVRK